MVCVRMGASKRADDWVRNAPSDAVDDFWDSPFEWRLSLVASTFKISCLRSCSTTLVCSLSPSHGWDNLG